MTRDRVGRRTFIKRFSHSAVVVPLLPADSLPAALRPGEIAQAPAIVGGATPTIRFSVIGLNHGHINSMTTAVQAGGGELVSVFAHEPELVEAFVKRFPSVRVARSEDEVLEDTSTQLLLSASIPNERGPLTVRAMRHGKDVFVDKPGVTTLAQLADVRRVQAETRRIYAIAFTERLENRATVRAGELVQTGAIGRVVQTVGLGPHRLNLPSRPAWFFDRARAGGILCDIASHQADQFLFFTGSTEAEVVSAQTGNVNHPQYPDLEDFGDMLLRGNRGTGYARVDWFTPDGLPTWGDGRLTILGTDGFIEVRKNVDLAGRSGGNHLFISDRTSTRYIDCRDVDLPHGRQLVSDVVNRTETATPQAHSFLATELALRAQETADRLRFGS